VTAFPTIYAIDSEGYSVVADDGAEQLRAASGKLRIHRLYNANRYNITIRLAGLTAAQTLAVDQFYESYKNEEITWTDPYTELVYDVVMRVPPRIADMRAPLAWVEVQMEGTRQ
jgi:hypothetical protein